MKVPLFWCHESSKRVVIFAPTESVGHCVTILNLSVEKSFLSDLYSLHMLKRTIATASDVFFSFFQFVEAVGVCTWFCWSRVSFTVL